MPISVAAIRERRAACTVEISPDATVVIDYRPVRLAELIESGEVDVDRPDTLQESREALATQLVEVVVGWDVTRDVEGTEPFPLDSLEIADTFDIGFLNKCLTSIAEHYMQGKVTGELLSRPGIATTSPRAGVESSPAGAANRVSRRSASSSKSRSKAGLSRVRLQR